MNDAEQVDGQLMPAGELVTVPDPLPPPVSVRVAVNCGGGCGLNVAVTALAEFKVTLHEPVPEQAPLQPLKIDPAAGEAARLTAVPDA